MYTNRPKVGTQVKKKKVKTIFLIMVLLCTVTFIIIFKTDLLNVKSVKVIGNENLSEEQIVSYDEGIIGLQIFKIKPENVKANIMKNPYIKTASVKRKLPNKILIEIRERKEMAIVPFMGTFLIIDEEGVVLNSDTQVSELKVIKGLEFSNFMEGSKLQVTDSDQLDKALLLAKTMQNTSIDIKEIDVSNKRDLMIRLTGSLSCKLGEGSGLDYKMKVLKGILLDLQSKGITRGVIDISHEGNPSYSPVE